MKDSLLEKRNQTLLCFLENQKAYFYASEWAKTTLPGQRFFQRFATRIKIFGPRYLLSALIHYVTIAFPKLGRIKVRSKTFWGKNVTIELRAAEAFRLLFGGAPGAEPEVRLTYFLLRTLTDRDVFYDVGANIGYYSMLAAEIGAEVHAFEPVPSTFSILKANLEEYGSRVFSTNSALCETDGVITIYLPPDWYVTSTIIEETLERIGTTLTVPALQLDTYVESLNHRPPTIIKIDVEGAESLVLAGGKSVIENFRPIVVIEVCPGQRGKELSVPAAEFLLQRGYRMHRLDAEGIPQAISDPASDYIPRLEGEFENLVFLHHSTKSNMV
ncbi:MAG: FkbM family methyltransferase [Bacteroidota bacterium]|nr:FkbM family methyltransferase [Bacteroidota bacterium]